MREIKFRIWSKHQNKFISNATKYQRLAIGCGGGVYNGKYDSVDITEDHMYIQQYTGLLDKNGKEIYEGDIVKFHEPTELCEDYFMSSLYLFDFYEGSFTNPLVYCSINGSKFVKREPMLPLVTGRAKLDGNSFFDFKTAEIVGNIFENNVLC